MRPHSMWASSRAPSSASSRSCSATRQPRTSQSPWRRPRSGTSRLPHRGEGGGNGNGDGNGDGGDGDGDGDGPGGDGGGDASASGGDGDLGGGATGGTSGAAGRPASSRGTGLPGA